MDNNHLDNRGEKEKAFLLLKYLVVIYLIGITIIGFLFIVSKLVGPEVGLFVFFPIVVMGFIMLPLAILSIPVWFFALVYLIYTLFRKNNWSSKKAPITYSLILLIVLLIMFSFFINFKPVSTKSDTNTCKKILCLDFSK